MACKTIFSTNVYETTITLHALILSFLWMTKPQCYTSPKLNAHGLVIWFLFPCICICACVYAYGFVRRYAQNLMVCISQTPVILFFKTGFFIDSQFVNWDRQVPWHFLGIHMFPPPNNIIMYYHDQLFLIVSKGPHVSLVSTSFTELLPQLQFMPSEFFLSLLSNFNFALLIQVLIETFKHLN